MTAAWIHGIVLAFGLILPLGAQNIFIFNQGAYQSRFTKALPAVLTAAICDTVLVLLAVLGVSIIVFTITWLKVLIFAIGLVFLIYMGYSIWKSKPQVASSTNGEATVMTTKKQILFAMSVSLLNPHAILDTIGVIGTSSLSYEGSSKVVFTMATILISWLWFFGLAIVGRIVGKLDGQGKFLLLLNRLSALLIWGIAIYIGKQLFDILAGNS
ncbi:LysE family transporter [Paenibacillus sp. N1-5-1-14]|uniref:LysE/ArgO family amino acid transporter n=1 Tax=Paenibacillus radicibacter TaxID=2972488 RepID=UPI0021597169|nr:LysE family transporter [Paenibacillus radicibacter]MCR8642825.1 LysE family transporter [Paenibacillus radicibacter]